MWKWAALWRSNVSVMPRFLTVLDTAIGASPRVTASIAPISGACANHDHFWFFRVEGEAVLRKPSVDCKETVVQPGQVVVPQFDVELGIVCDWCRRTILHQRSVRVSCRYHVFERPFFHREHSLLYGWSIARIYLFLILKLTKTFASIEFNSLKIDFKCFRKSLMSGTQTMKE